MSADLGGILKGKSAASGATSLPAKPTVLHKPAPLPPPPPPPQQPPHVSVALNVNSESFQPHAAIPFVAPMRTKSAPLPDQQGPVPQASFVPTHMTPYHAHQHHQGPPPQQPVPVTSSPSPVVSVPAPPMQRVPPMALPMMGVGVIPMGVPMQMGGGLPAPPTTPTERRARAPLAIVDPNSNKTVIEGAVPAPAPVTAPAPAQSPRQSPAQSPLSSPSSGMKVSASAFVPRMGFLPSVTPPPLPPAAVGPTATATAISPNTAPSQAPSSLSASVSVFVPQPKQSAAATASVVAAMTQKEVAAPVAVAVPVAPSTVAAPPAVVPVAKGKEEKREEMVAPALTPEEEKAREERQAAIAAAEAAAAAAAATAAAAAQQALLQPSSKAAKAARKKAKKAEKLATAAAAVAAGATSAGPTSPVEKQTTSASCSASTTPSQSQSPSQVTSPSPPPSAPAQIEERKEQPKESAKDAPNEQVKESPKVATAVQAPAQLPAPAPVKATSPVSVATQAVPATPVAHVADPKETSPPASVAPSSAEKPAVLASGEKPSAVAAAPASVPVEVYKSPAVTAAAVAPAAPKPEVSATNNAPERQSEETQGPADINLRPQAGSLGSATAAPTLLMTGQAAEGDTAAQWAPPAPDSKRTYSRNFLMTFKDRMFSSQSQSPVALQNLLEILQKNAAGPAPRPRPIQRVYSANQPPVKPTLRPFRQQPVGPLRTNTNRFPPRPFPVLQPAFVVQPLATTENGWKRPVETAEEDKVKLGINASLSKLVQENIDLILTELNALNIPPELNTELISQIYDRALREPKFVGVYASLCKKLAVSLSGFKASVLNKCQEQWDSNNWKVTARVATEGLTEEEMEELRRKQDIARQRFMGNIAFMGELYREGLLITKIVHACIKALLDDQDNPAVEDMEALCKLLSAVGKKLEATDAQKQVDQYITRMASILSGSGSKLPARTRFLMQGVIELRQNGWAPRNPMAPKPVFPPVRTPPTFTRPAASPTPPGAVSPQSPAISPPPNRSQSPEWKGTRKLIISRKSSATAVSTTVGAYRSPAPQRPLAVANNKFGVLNTDETDAAPARQPSSLSRSHQAVKPELPAVSPSMSPPVSPSPAVPTSPSPSPSPMPGAAESTRQRTEAEELPPTDQERESTIKVVKTTVFELVESKDLEEATQCLLALRKGCRFLTVVAAVEWVMSEARAPKDAAEQVNLLFRQMREEDFLMPSQWRAAFLELAGLLPDAVSECGQSVEVVGVILGRAVVDLGLPLATVFEVLMPCAREEIMAPPSHKGCGFAIAAACECLYHVCRKDDTFDVSRGRSTYASCPIDIRSLIFGGPDPEESVMDESAVQALDAKLLETLRRFKVEDVMPALSSGALKRLSEELATADAATALESVIKLPKEVRDDPDTAITVVRLVLLQVNGSAAQDDSAFLAQLSDKWMPVIGAVLGRQDESAAKGEATTSPRARMGVICAAQAVWVKRSRAKDLLLAIVNVLNQTSLVCDDDVSIWRKDTSDRTPCKKEALDELSEEDDVLPVTPQATPPPPE